VVSTGAASAHRRRLPGAFLLALAGTAALPAATLTHPLPASASTAGPATAGPATATVQQGKADLDESSQGIIDALDALHRAESGLPAARESATNAQSRLAAARSAYTRAVNAQASAQSAVVDSEQRATQVRQVADGQRDTLARMARQAYIAGPADVSAFLELTSPGSFDASAISIEHVLSAQQHKVDTAVTLLGRVRADAGRLDARRAAARDAASAAEQAYTRVQQQQAAATRAFTQVATLVAARSSALARARAARADDAAHYAELQREATVTTANVAAGAPKVSAGVPAAASGASVAPLPGVLIRPVPGPVTSPFGMRVHPITHVYKLHTGTDFHATCGTPVQTAADGTVLEAGVNAAYGNRVVVVHQLGPQQVRIATTYNHMQRLEVRPGQTLTQGEVLGHVGSTGYSTGCHLHFEVISGGAYVDPMAWLVP
jgi:murein DD-endopeptidase MepM/ murein hydrolase activator NlpD